jgi:hypothetical protein
VADLALVDPTENPHLTGRFAPVTEEIDAAGVRVEGDLPAELAGAYLRNGPNPKFPPLGSYTYPMEGDGMLHGVWFEGGRARYANRYVRTQSLLAEERAGRQTADDSAGVVVVVIPVVIAPIPAIAVVAVVVQVAIVVAVAIPPAIIAELTRAVGEIIAANGHDAGIGALRRRLRRLHRARHESRTRRGRHSGEGRRYRQGNNGESFHFTHLR